MNQETVDSQRLLGALEPVIERKTIDDLFCLDSE
jgi:hypothetical protein